MTEQEPLFPGIETVPKSTPEATPETTALDRRVEELSAIADELRWSVGRHEEAARGMWDEIRLVQQAITKRARIYPPGSEGREAARGALFDFLSQLGDKNFHNRRHRSEAAAWAWVDKLIEPTDGRDGGESHG